jgi:glyoxylase-like metal-dependent hydrolase (beta-lactamase superfamily II)
MSKLIDHGNGIFAVDADYVRPHLAAIHLIEEKGRVAFVDAGCNSSLLNVLAALAELGVAHENVDFVILTHVHLDHAGGAGAMMHSFPNARLVVHPRGARHMVDPARLIAGSVAVYGAEGVRRLYGDILPVAAERIVETSHGCSVDLAGRTIVCLDTPGHAKHHIALVDDRTGHVFTGDIFGVSYREIDRDGRQFVFPTTTPVQFDPLAMHASIDLLLGFRPEAAYLTHFSKIKDVAEHAVNLHRMVDAHVAIAQRERGAGKERHARIRDGLAQLLLDEIGRFGCALPATAVLEIYANDLELNAQGLGVWLDNQSVV